MRGLARFLTIYSDLPVFDRTGIAASWSLRIDTPPDDLVRESLRKLGLRLVREKTPREMLIVDHIEKPSVN